MLSSISFFETVWKVFSSKKCPNFLTMSDLFS
jgi:hypothetical protein